MGSIVGETPPQQPRHTLASQNVRRAKHPFCRERALLLPRAEWADHPHKPPALNGCASTERTCWPSRGTGAMGHHDVCLAMPRSPARDTHTTLTSETSSARCGSGGARAMQRNTRSSFGITQLNSTAAWRRDECPSRIVWLAMPMPRRAIYWGGLWAHAGQETRRLWSKSSSELRSTTRVDCRRGGIPVLLLFNPAARDAGTSKGETFGSSARVLAAAPGDGQTDMYLFADHRCADRECAAANEALGLHDAAFARGVRQRNLVPDCGADRGKSQVYDDNRLLGHIGIAALFPHFPLVWSPQTSVRAVAAGIARSNGAGN
ncbi:hypothetical protein Purlil1_2736 [Purpureocillium lilacinum]|uniref:DUF1643 domain-containing protein n=1 Tax=Purpureocillium lilacinum TaxID=33203 RepID=A0ABR0C9R1_PURLI|nr:hypothetical protein Purlil1_2736 [Purpureocillium lilacinum]